MAGALDAPLPNVIAPAAAPAPIAAPVGTPAPAAPAPWYGELPDPELKGYAELKAWKSPSEAIKAAREAERMIGVPKDELLRLPKDLTAAKPEELDAIYNRLGRPAAATDYKLPEIPGGEEFRGAMAPLLHSAGLNQAQASKLAEGWNAYNTAQQQAFQQAEEQKAQLNIEGLRKEWPGALWPERTQLARNTIARLGLTQEETTAMELAVGTSDQPGVATVIRALAKIGEVFKEGSQGKEGFVDGNNASSRTFGLTPAAAHARLQELMGDREWGAKVLNNPKGPEALEQDRLQRIAVGAGVR